MFISYTRIASGHLARNLSFSLSRPDETTNPDWRHLGARDCVCGRMSWRASFPLPTREGPVQKAQSGLFYLKSLLSCPSTRCPHYPNSPPQHQLSTSSSIESTQGLLLYIEHDDFLYLHHRLQGRAHAHRQDHTHVSRLTQGTICTIGAPRTNTSNPLSDILREPRRHPSDGSSEAPRHHSYPREQDPVAPRSHPTLFLSPRRPDIPRGHEEGVAQDRWRAILYGSVRTSRPIVKAILM
jgi:hypothetical protein